MKENVITVIGSINYDIIFKQKRFAEKGETITADTVAFAGGGKGANQAVQCAKLGAETYMVAAVGNDNFGELLLSNLKKYGVNTDNVMTAESNTGLGVINALEDGTLVSTISTGANYKIDKKNIDEIEYLLEKSKIVILQLEIPTDVVEYAISKAQEHGCFIILNAAPAKEISDSALSKVNCLVVNEPEASFYSGETITDAETAINNCEKLFGKVKDLVIITLGENGSVIYDGKQKVHVPAKKVKAVESTGAGDSYIGAFAYKLLTGSQYSEAADFAASAGAFTVTKVGAQDSMPVLKDLSDL
jgi:ribokinase